MWVERAQADFDEFVEQMRARGIEVLEMHELLAQTLDSPTAREWVLDRKLTPGSLGPGLIDDVVNALMAMPSDRLAEHLIGGLTAADLGLPASTGSYLEMDEFVLPPLPNAMFPRDCASWIDGGVVLNRAWWPARRGEVVVMEAIYRFHPRFASAGFQIWWGECAEGPAFCTVNGSDVMALGEGVVLIGVNERTSARGAVQIARALFNAGAARKLIAAQMPSTEASLPLNAVFTQCSPQVVTYAPEVVDRIVCHEIRPALSGGDVQCQRHAGEHLLDVLSNALEVPAFNAIATGGDPFHRHTERWDDGNNLLALAPGVVVGYDRNTRTNKRLRQAGIEVIEIPGGELGRGRVGAHGLSLPISRDGVSYR
jgi:arginine deiminase